MDCAEIMIHGIKRRTGRMNMDIFPIGMAAVRERAAL
jgi:hypothetical protein